MIGWVCWVAGFVCWMSALLTHYWGGLFTAAAMMAFGITAVVVAPARVKRTERGAEEAAE